MNSQLHRAIIARRIVACALVVSSANSWAQAPDATATGPLATTSSEYQFPASVDSAVLGDRATEIWARLYRPATLDAGTRYPLIVFLHGNHATCGTGANPRIDNDCTYTTSGTCPAGYVVVPNHQGYEYLATKLASWGYLVVSINANRGITCGAGVSGDAGLNLARGRLILRHLQRLSDWNNNPGQTPLSLGLGPDGLLGQVDFGNVGLMGHSRGGEGVRAAYNLYPLPSIPITDPVSFQAIFEIGPVDGQTSMVLDARNTVWNVLLPACDGDVSNLQGVKPFDRMMRTRPESSPSQKSTYFVHGANHNFYNTEWQQSDSAGCVGFNNPALWSPGDIGSSAQRDTSLASVLALLRGNVVSPVPSAFNPAFNQNFNPRNSLLVPPTTVKRGFTNSPDPSVTSDCGTILEDFDQFTGTSSCGVANCATSGFSISHPASVPNHDPQQKAAVVSWSSPGAFTTNSQAPGAGTDISAYATLDFRVSRQNSALNPTSPTDFLVSLVMDDGTTCGTFSGTVPISAYLDPLEGPVGSFAGGLHPILQTVRIPLGDIPNVDLTIVRGVRFDFGVGTGTATGAIYMSNIRLSRAPGPGARPLDEVAETLARFSAARENVPSWLDVPSSTNVITDIRRVPSALNRAAGFEIELSSDREFPVRGEMPVLVIGDARFVLSRYPNDGTTHTLIFSLTDEEFAEIPFGAALAVQYGDGAARDLWEFGPLTAATR